MTGRSAVGSAPCTVVDRRVLRRNIEAAAALAAEAGIALRPHAKTHKSPEVAAIQLAAGAAGLSVATVGEAEVFADAGVGDLFIALPVWPGPAIASRLAALCDRAVVTVGADSPAGVGALAARVPASSGLRVAVEVDCGLGRTGTAPGRAGVVARAARDAGYQVAGVFTFPGHSYRPGAAAEAAEQERAALARARTAVEAAGVDCPVRSGGSTPSLGPALQRADGDDVVTELRPGVYAFNDAQQVALGVATTEEVALWVLGRVVSAPAAGRIVLDSGSKLLGPDRPHWVSGHGLLPDHPGAVVTGLWEHHAVVDVSACERVPAVGDAVRVIPNHVCTAVNLVDELLVVDGDDTVAERWPVAARGRNR